MIVGSSAGALLGLQFVVITFVTQSRAIGNIRDIHAFGTPTVTYFCSALLLSAGMSAPWRNFPALAITLAGAAIVGLAYSVRVLLHARAADYRPDLEDWAWYIVLPFIGYVILLAGAVLLCLQLPPSLVAIACSTVLFLILGVHNAWDTVTFIAVRHARSDG